MRCEHCGENDAQITYTTVEGNETKELHICRLCFETLFKQQFPAVEIPSLDIQPMLKELLSMFQMDTEGRDEKACPNCKTTLAAFRKTGMFGCDCCYTFFSEELAQILPRIQGADVHIGEKPLQVLADEAMSEKVHKLKEDLDLAIAEERYEDAAVIRDEIQKIQEDEHEK